MVWSGLRCELKSPYGSADHRNCALASTTRLASRTGQTCCAPAGRPRRHHVAGGEAVEHPEKLAPVAVRARHLLAVDIAAAASGGASWSSLASLLFALGIAARLREISLIGRFFDAPVAAFFANDHVGANSRSSCAAQLVGCSAGVPRRAVVVNRPTRRKWRWHATGACRNARSHSACARSGQGRVYRRRRWWWDRRALWPG